MASDLSNDELMRGVLPYLVMPDTTAAIAFYQKAFGATGAGEVARDDKGRVMNVSLAINDGILMLMDDMRGSGSFAPTRARGCCCNWSWPMVRPGGTAPSKPAATEIDAYKRQFWGDNWGRLRDPFGLDWALLEPSAEHKARPPPRARANFRDQRGIHRRRHELADIAAQPGDLLDQFRGDRLVPRLGHQEHRLDRGVERPVHPDHLEFVFEIRHRPQAADDDLRADIAGAVDQEVLERMHDDLDPGRSRRSRRSRPRPSPPVRPAKTAAPCRG